MDTNEKPKRPSWRRKRVWAAAVLVFAVAYPASIGPLCYAYHRGWVTNREFHALIAPWFALFPWDSAVGRACDPYFDWCRDLALKHDPLLVPWRR